MLGAYSLDGLINYVPQGNEYYHEEPTLPATEVYLELKVNPGVDKESAIIYRPQHIFQRAYLHIHKSYDCRSCTGT